MIAKLIIAIMFMSSVAWAAPPKPVTANGYQFTGLGGAGGFGVKTAASPLIYSDFETDTTNVTPSQWTVRSGAATVSTLKPYAGTKSMRSAHPSCATSNQVQRDLGAGSISDKMYMSANFYLEKNDSSLGYQWKVWRWSSSPNIYYSNGSPDILSNISSVHVNAFWNGTASYYAPPTTLGWYNSGSNYYAASGAITAALGTGTRNMYGDQNSWFRFSQEVQLSSAPDAADGWIKSYRDGVLTTTWSGLVTHATGDSIYRHFMLTNEIESCASPASMNIYTDNVYIDNTFARVELCDSSTSYATSTHCEIQPPTSWSDTAITTTYNPGSFATGATAYFYVIDSTGAASPASAAFTVTDGATVVPVNGTCGTASGQSFVTIPTTNLCTAGTATAVSGTTTWTWGCNGINGGTSTSATACQATYSAVVVPPVVGSASLKASGRFSAR